MALPIITADQRLREKKGVKLVLLGKSGIGKTTQLKTLPEDKTLFVDLEAGDLAVKDWRGDCVRPTTWPEFRDLVVFLAGPNPALPPEAPYSQAHYAHVCEQYGDPSQLTKYDCYFVDSITVLARLALIWAKTQPQAMSDRTGKPDTRGAYGLLGSEMLGALMHPWINSVTRHDMHVSITAGFAAGEIPRLLGLAPAVWSFRETSTWRGARRVIGWRT